MTSPGRNTLCVLGWRGSASEDTLIWDGCEFSIFTVPRQRAKSLIPSLLNHLRDGKLPKLHSPRNSYDFVYVKDAAVAFERAVSRDLSSGIYHLGSGVATPVVDICRMAERIVNGSEILTRKLELDTVNTSCTADFWADCSWTRQELGWIPETSLDEGIFQTWQWITQQ